jgi:putative tryptophan/tyrosine transport system substrate-binding protein
MKRREFIALLSGAAAAWPVAARAQQSGMPVIGVLSIRSSGDPTARAHLSALRQGLDVSGFVEGRNFSIEYGWADGRNERFPALVAELVARQVTVMVTPSTPAALAAKAATSTIPIVFIVGGDPVKSGLVASLNRPAGNRTGTSIIALDVAAKRLEILREMVPSAAKIGFLSNPTNPFTEPEGKEVGDAASSLGLQLHVGHASREMSLDSAFATLVEKGVSALLLSADPFLFSKIDQIVALATRYGLPMISGYHEFASAGGLMAYGSFLMDSFRVAGVYTGRILKGEKPGELPVQQSTKISLIVNLKTAKALGIEIPPTLLARADEAIE